MKSNLYGVIGFSLIMTFFLSSNKNDLVSLNDEIIGVWSGTLFQTYPIFDSLYLHSDMVFLFKSGKEVERVQLNEVGNRFIGRGKGGLRIDIGHHVNGNPIIGLITHDLWVKNLNFVKHGDGWYAKLKKAEIIDTDYKVFLEFYRDQNGELSAQLQSNKENRKLHFTIEDVIRENDQIQFKISNPRFQISAQYIKDENIIRLHYINPGGKRAIDLKKLHPANQIGYRPSLPNSTYEYSPPQPLAGIETAAINEVGIDTSLLSLFSEINNGNFDHIHSLLIIKDNKLVLEEYFHGYGREDIKDIRSAFKSISSMLLGKTIDDGLLAGVNTPILEYYPAYDTVNNIKKEITIEHALTMTTGIQLEDEDEMQWNSIDWAGYKLNLPMTAAPGEKYEYSSGGMNLLSGVIRASSKEYLPYYLYSRLLLPMDINDFQMLTSPYGRGYLAGNCLMRPVDFIKFGLLLLNKGKWENNQILSEEWINQMTSTKVACSYPKEAGYGYLWRIVDRQIQGKTYQSIEAWGNGGQFLIIIPALNMCVSFTGGNYNLFPEMEERPFRILEEYIFPSIKVDH